MTRCGCLHGRGIAVQLNYLLDAGADGNLYWIIDGFTESSSYPYSRQHTVDENEVNYVRNSVKVVIDAYNGTTNFYVFDSEDPIIAAYRATFVSPSATT